jgi:hypothetical protein
MGSGLLKVVGTSAHIGGQVITLKGQTCSLGMAFTKCACAFLDESLAWVLRKSFFYEFTTPACNSPLAFAILRRSARSIPLFRADAPPIHLKNRRTFALFTK